MKTDFNQLYTLDNVTRDYFKTLESLLFDRLYLLNDVIEKCKNEYELEHLHKQRDQVINHMLVHENKVEEIKDVNGACYTVLKS